MRKQDGMCLICFHFGFQNQTSGFGLEGTGIFLGAAENRRFLCSKGLRLARPLQTAAHPAALGCCGSRARLLLAQGQRWETLPAPRSPSAGLRREVTWCVRKAVPCPAHGDYLLGLMKEQFSLYTQQAPSDLSFPYCLFYPPPLPPRRPVPVSNTIHQVKHGKRNRQGR